MNDGTHRHARPVHGIVLVCGTHNQGDGVQTGLALFVQAIYVSYSELDMYLICCILWQSEGGRTSSFPNLLSQYAWSL